MRILVSGFNSITIYSHSKTFWNAFPILLPVVDCLFNKHGHSYFFIKNILYLVTVTVQF